MLMERPTGVIAVAALYFTVAAYLAVLAALMLCAPGRVSMRMGAAFLGGLELAGPLAFLFAAVVAALTAWGLLRLNNWARRAAALLALIGIVFLVQPVSSAVISFNPVALFWGGLGVMVRVMVAWYLYQRPVIDVFERLT
jgi:hypothetical protein